VELALIFGTSFLAGLSGAIVPGPLLTVAIDESTRRGFRAGPLLVVGHGLIEAPVVLALVLGLSHLIQGSLVAGTIGVLGGVVLLWMGYGMGRQAWRGTISLKGAGGIRQGPGTVTAGALVSAANPYWLLWWATVGAAYVTWSLQWGTLGLALFFGGHILSDLGWYSLVAALVATGRRLLTDKVYRGLILVCALFLVGLGVSFVTSGVASLWG
jgi:threonine/homoserine/homoserine lactone efflux protein